MRDEEKPLALKDIEFDIPAGTLNMVIGKIGSGKSALFDLLLNEMITEDSSITISGKIAYVSQNSWLQNDSIKNNILFGKPYNEELY